VATEVAESPGPSAIRRAGAALVAGGLLMATGVVLIEVFDRRDEPGRVDLGLTLVAVGSLLLLVGVALIQRRHRSRSRVLGWTAFALLAVGLLFGGQVARDYLILGMPFAVTGAALFGIAIVRARVLPGLPGWLLAAGIPVSGVILLATFDASESYLPAVVYGVVFPLPFVLLGAELWRQPQAASTTSP
jgi:hypothetical protein